MRMAIHSPMHIENEISGSTRKCPVQSGFMITNAMLEESSQKSQSFVKPHSLSTLSIIQAAK